MSDVDRINLRAPTGDHTVSFEPRTSWGEARTFLRLTADNPLEYGYDETGTYLDKQSLGRLLHWLQTGEALDRDDPRIPEVFGGAA